MPIVNDRGYPKPLKREFDLKSWRFGNLIDSLIDKKLIRDEIKN